MARTELQLPQAEPHRSTVGSAVEHLASHHVVERILAHDHTVWKPDPEGISDRLGWLDCARGMLPQQGNLQALAAGMNEDGLSAGVLLGMGGSSLAAEVLSAVLAEPGAPARSLSVLDTTDPDVIHALEARCDLDHTLFLVATKSGTTTETLSLFNHFYSRMLRSMGAEKAGRRFLAITDPGSPLQALAERLGFRRVVLNDPEIGGRFSALSYFGLVPAALLGTELDRLLSRALAMKVLCDAGGEAGANPGLGLGAALGALAETGKDKLTLVISPALAGLGDWIEQLIAESTGKEGKGILPVVDEPLGPPEVYGADRVFVDLRLEGDDSGLQELGALKRAGHPVIRLRLRDAYDLGAQFYLWEFATAVACAVLGVNPFDQPDVEAAKARASEAVERYRSSRSLPEDPPNGGAPETLAELLDGALPGGYIVLQAFVAPTQETDGELAALRACLRDRLRLATTVGYGPRFLHSTGQLHKGGPDKGLFVQFTSDSVQDLPIPDVPGATSASLSFGVLKAAQALGDRQALRERGRRVIHIHLGQDVPGGLQSLRECLG